MRGLLVLLVAVFFTACGEKCPVCGKAPTSSKEVYEGKGALDAARTTYVCPAGHSWKP